MDGFTAPTALKWHRADHHHLLRPAQYPRWKRGQRGRRVATWELGPCWNTATLKRAINARAFLRSATTFIFGAEATARGSILVVKVSYANAFVPYLVWKIRPDRHCRPSLHREKVDSFIQRGGYGGAKRLLCNAGTRDTFASRAGIGDCARPALNEKTVTLQEAVFLCDWLRPTGIPPPAFFRSYAEPRDGRREGVHRTAPAFFPGLWLAFLHIRAGREHIVCASKKPGRAPPGRVRP